MCFGRRRGEGIGDEPGNTNEDPDASEEAVPKGEGRAELSFLSALRQDVPGNRPRIMVRSPTSLPSVPLGPSPSVCPTAEFSPAVRASVCEPGVPTQSDTDGSAVPVQVRSGTDLRRSRGSRRCPPGPLPPPLCWTSPVARLLAC